MFILVERPQGGLAVLVVIALLSVACAATPPDVERLIAVIGHGSDEDVSDLMYGADQLTPEAHAIGLRLIRELRVPPVGGELERVAERRRGRLRMVILRAPWLEGTPHGTHRPVLLLSRGGEERIIGTVLPFNDLVPLLGEEIVAEAAPLSAWYVENHATR